MTKKWPRLLHAGDEAVVVEFGDKIDGAINDRVYHFASVLRESDIPGVTELVPTYRSLLVQYDSDQAGYDEMAAALKPLLKDAEAVSAAVESQVQVFEFPVHYGGEDGPDLQTVAQHAKLPPEEVVRIHSSTAYRVYMLGFAPGFPYLGGMDPRIACPRLKTPRTKVPAGSVGIAESQTGVYPNDSPGGWQIIGRTPVPLFDPSEDPPTPIRPGSRIQFVSVDETEMSRVQAQIKSGDYKINVKAGDK